MRITKIDFLTGQVIEDRDFTPAEVAEVEARKAQHAIDNPPKPKEITAPELFDALKKKGQLTDADVELVAIP